MKRPALFIFILAFLIALQVKEAKAAVNCPGYADTREEFETIVRSALLDVLGDPNSPNLRITAAELKDISRFLNEFKGNWNSADCLKSYAPNEPVPGTGETMRFILEKYTKVYEGSTCIVTARSWSVNKIYEGQDVALQVAGGGVCAGESVGFLIKEDDFLDADDDVLQNPLSVAFGADNTAKGTWKAEWQDDGPLGGNPEYYFKTVFNGITSKENSPLLDVLFCKDEDKDGFKDIICGGLDCDDDPKNTTDPLTKIVFHKKGGADNNPKQVEVCNEKDEDSNAADVKLKYTACVADNGLGTFCACSPGAPTDKRTPGKDDCDNWDNDCDGSVDEDFRRAANKDWSVCRVDFDGDKCTGVNDFMIFMNAFGKKAGDVGWNPVVDLEQSGSSKDVIDMKDFDVFAGVFSGACDNDKYCSGPKASPPPKCGVNQGVCFEGQAQCLLNVWAVITDIYSPLFPAYCVNSAGKNTAPEARIETLCDYRDENCNAVIDENLKRQCTDFTGTKTSKCGKYLTCDAVCPQPPNEVCNNQDDDCDGVKDEGLPWCQCNGGNPAQSDLCDNKDNDCDGLVDEDVRLAGTQWWNVCKVDFNNDKCTGVVDLIIFTDAFATKPGDKNWNPQTDLVQNNYIDFDDFFIYSAVFEGACPTEQKCVEGQLGGACGSDVGECVVGKVKCFLGVMPPTSMSMSNALFSTLCVNSVVPATEVCDYKDNDCDSDNPLYGGTDEGLRNACNTCGQTPTEVCDGKDNDCDGLVDEQVTLSCKDPNTCLPYPSCNTCPALKGEVCNNKDDDCDGIVDDGVANCGCSPANINDKYKHTPGKDSCDAIDNDCDGSVDEDEKWYDGFGNIELCRANLDGLAPKCVGFNDYLVFNNHFNSCRPGSPDSRCDWGVPWNSAADFDNDGYVGLDDLFAFAFIFEGTCDSDKPFCNYGDKKVNSCGSDVGECDYGDLQCFGAKSGVPGSGVWASAPIPFTSPAFDFICLPSYPGEKLKPSSEVCDGRDNDCDGSVDEGINCCTLQNGGWSSWSSWNACSTSSCGTTGTQSSTAYCNNPYPSCGGSNCACPSGASCSYTLRDGKNTYTATRTQTCSPGPCPSCNYNTCDSCTWAGPCGWCKSTNNCRYGDSSGALRGGTCSGSNWVWTSSNCPKVTTTTTTTTTIPLTCGRFTSCNPCLFQSAYSEYCGWCGSSGTCIRAASSSGKKPGSCASNWKWFSC